VSDEPCPICEVPLLPADRMPTGDWDPFKCRNCGRFGISGRLLAENPRPWTKTRRARAVVSHAIRLRQRANDSPRLDRQLLASILAADDLPTPPESLDLLLLYIGDQQGAPGHRVEVYLDVVRALIGAQSREDVAWALQALHSTGLVVSDQAAGAKQTVSLTLSGWKHYEELRRGRVDSRRAFMAMQYRERDLEHLYAETLKPAVAKTGFSLVRLDEDPPAGLIDVRLRAELRRARFLLADLTHENAGAYWEAGFMEGLGRPVIYLCRADVFEKEKSHFDTNHSHHVIWDSADPHKCAREVVATIRATLPGEARMED
jgi:hypothetical protein